jgi:hypothetical protein
VNHRRTFGQSERASCLSRRTSRCSPRTSFKSGTTPCLDGRTFDCCRTPCRCCRRTSSRNERSPLRDRRSFRKDERSFRQSNRSDCSSSASARRHRFAFRSGRSPSDPGRRTSSSNGSAFGDDGRYVWRGSSSLPFCRFPGPDRHAKTLLKDTSPSGRSGHGR